MRNLLLFALMCFISMPSFAQLNCSSLNPSISASTSGATVTVTNSSTPTATSNIRTYYYFQWGDGNMTPKQNNSSASHTYVNSGTYTIKMIQQVLDSQNNITCYDSTTTSVNITVPALSCNNAGAGFSLTATGLSATLTNTSTPTPTNNIQINYHISWGDGSTTNASNNASKNHTYNTGGTYTVQLIATWNDTAYNVTCHDTATNNITVSGGATQLNCNDVNAGASVSANGLNATLVNNSTNTSNAAVKWSTTVSWGDGSSTGPTTSMGNLTHTYNAGGMYSILLFFTVTDTVNNITCTDSVFRTITINSPNKISGYIIPDSNLYNPGDSFKVWLITFDTLTNILAAVDSQIVPVFSQYNFVNKASGVYRTKAALHNGPTSGTAMLPTYHTSSLLWNQATVINHNGGSSINKTIVMQVGTATTGPGFVGGNVSQGANKGTGSGIAGMDIFLMDANSNVIAATVTDANGDYSFSNLPIATYQIHPENLSYKTTPATIVVDANNLKHEAIHFERSKKDLTIAPKAAGINDINSAKLNYVVYPNPAKDVVNINWAELSDDAANITITDISGKKVYDMQTTMTNNTVINVQGLQAGFYFLNIATEAGNNTQKLVIE